MTVNDRDQFSEIESRETTLTDISGFSALSAFKGGRLKMRATNTLLMHSHKPSRRLKFYPMKRPNQNCPEPRTTKNH